MKQIFISICFFICLPLCSQNLSGLKVTELAPKVFNAMLKVSQGATLIDVQTSDQFAEAHLINANSLPQKKDLIDFINCLDKSQKVFVYCKFGERSNQVGRLLLEHDFIYVYSLKGGVDAWKSYNLEVESDRIDKK